MATKLCPGVDEFYKGIPFLTNARVQNLWSLRNSAGEAPDDQARETHAIPPFTRTNCALMKSTLPVRIKGG